MFKVASMFCGVGGLCQGFTSKSSKIIWANEIDKKACETYRANFGDSYLVEDDISNIDISSILDFDILLSGFPCQAFSIAGNQQGFDDPRGNMFFETLRLIKYKKPKIIFLENVKNLLTHNKGKTFSIIKKHLVDCGYDVHYKVLNTAKYGNLPQNRERLYIVCFDKPTNYIFPGEILLTVTPWDLIDPNKQENRYYYNSDSQYYKMLDISIVNNSIYQLRRIYVRENKTGVCPTLTANMGTGGHNVPIIRDNYGIRKLTPRECFRFQGFDDSYILPNISNGALYKQAGNSVSIPVIRRIFESISNSGILGIDN